MTGRVARVLLNCLGLVAGVAVGGAACAGDSNTDLLSAEKITVAADVRLVGVNGERSWLDGGFGKTRYGGEDAGRRSNFQLRPKFSDADLIWQPRLSWALSGTVVANLQDEPKLKVGLSEAFVSYKPLSESSTRFSARAGLMWPPVSLEHSRPEWAVTETITPSAINSWIGEEVKVVGAEMTGATSLGEHRLSATTGAFDVNDTAGAMIAYRGWALHDQKATAFLRQPLPTLNSFIQYVQPRYSHPLKEMDHGFGNRVGYYVKLAWEPPAPVRLEAFHYDNHGDPLAVDKTLEWGWRTHFEDIGAVVDLSDSTQIRTQALTGRTRMGAESNGAIWIDTRFRSAYALITRQLAKGSLSGRLEAFGTRNHGSTLVRDDNEDGWALTLAGRHEINNNMTAQVELLHVESARDARRRDGLAPKQAQDLAQVALKLRW